MHPALRSRRDELHTAAVRTLAVVSGVAVVWMLAVLVLPHGGAPAPPTAPRSDWVTVERPFPAFTLAIPEASDAPAAYTIQRNEVGGGRKDILGLGDPDGAEPYLHVTVYRAGSEIAHFLPAYEEIATAAYGLLPANMRSEAPLDSKFGPLSIVAFATGNGKPRQCLGFARAYDDPMLQISGWFCRGGEAIARETLACALDRLTLLAAGSEPKVGALFAGAELHRSYCGQHDPILAATPKYKLLWKALATRPAPRRIGR